ncbi:MAG: glycosyltransferase family 4 protein, partial [Pseudobdellovibrionaceae bacterium]
MKILHLLKTSSGGDWAAKEVTELVKLGLEIHVVLPSTMGSTMSLWQISGAHIHYAEIDFPVRAPWQLFKRLKKLRNLVQKIQPNLIHSHFFGTTILARLALGKKHSIPRVFQVPGPLHLENRFFRLWDIGSAGSADFWIASSDYIQKIYLKAGVLPSRVFRSYYGIYLPETPASEPTPIENEENKNFKLHDLLEVPRTSILVGNVSHIYPPKFYLGQRTGVKCHEDLIDSLSEVVKQDSRVIGVLIGGGWQGKLGYEKQLRQRAQKKAGTRIRMLGFIENANELWRDFDLAIHVPRSENCGGVVEPLLVRVPVIAANIGGLPEVIEDGKTGYLVPTRNPKA